MSHDNLLRVNELFSIRRHGMRKAILKIKQLHQLTVPSDFECMNIARLFRA